MRLEGEMHVASKASLAKALGHPGEFELHPKSYGNPIGILSRKVSEWAGFPLFGFGSPSPQIGESPCDCTPGWGLG